MPLGEVNNVYIADGEVNGVHLGRAGQLVPQPVAADALTAALIYPVWLTLPRAIP
jgi:hypothetical protein